MSRTNKLLQRPGGCSLEYRETGTTPARRADKGISARNRSNLIFGRPLYLISEKLNFPDKPPALVGSSSSLLVDAGGLGSEDISGRERCSWIP
jgi:hypothetical protein